MNRRRFLIGLGLLALTPIVTAQGKRSAFGEVWDLFQKTFKREDDLAIEYATDFNENKPAPYKISAKRVGILDELIQNNKSQTKCYEKLKKLEMGK